MSRTGTIRQMVDAMQSLSRLQFGIAQSLIEEMRTTGADEYEIDHIRLFADKARGDTIAIATHADIICQEIEAHEAGQPVATFAIP